MKKIVSIFMSLILVAAQTKGIVFAMKSEKITSSFKGSPINEKLKQTIIKGFEDKYNELSANDKVKYNSKNAGPIKWENFSDPIKDEIFDKLLDEFLKEVNLSKPIGEKISSDDDLKQSLKELFTKVDPKSEDFRCIEVLNIPEFMGKTIDKSFLNQFLNLHIISRKSLSLHNKKIEANEFVKSYTTELGEKYSNDPECLASLGELSKEFNVNKDDFANIMIGYELSEALLEKYSKDTLKSLIADGLLTAVATVAVAGGVAAAWHFGGLAGLATVLSTTAATVGIAIGVAGVAIVGIIGGIIGLCILDNADDKVIELFKTQRYQNIAFFMKQFLEFMSSKPDKVMDSNAFVKAIDYRNFKTSGLFWHLRNKNLPNHGAFCEFRKIEGLPFSPVAKDYKSDYGRYMSYFIDIIRDLELRKAYGRDTEGYYKRLEEYVNGKKMPRQITFSYKKDNEDHVLLGVDIKHPEEILERFDEFDHEEQNEIISIIARTGESGKECLLRILGPVRLLTGNYNLSDFTQEERANMFNSASTNTAHQNAN